MNNPYNHPRLRRLKRNSKLRYGMAVVSHFPKYVVWQISRVLPDEMGLRIRRKFGFLDVIIQNLGGFVRFWLHSRPWKKLLVAIPLLLVLAWIVSILFLVNNQTEEELYGEYRTSLFRAVSLGDYKLADFLAGKLLLNPAFERDEQLLFATMIAAHEMRNIPRRDLLLAKLTGELDSPRAHMWQASNLLSSRASGQANVTKAIEHIKTAIELSDNPDPMKIQLVNIYFQQRRFQQAITMLEELDEKGHTISVLQASLYLAGGDKDKAYTFATSALQRMDDENPEKDQYIKERLDALTVLSDIGGGHEYVKNELLSMASLLEGSLEMNPEDDKLKSLLVVCYMVVGKVMFHENDEEHRRKALIYLEKAVATGKVPYRMGALVLSASNLDSSGGVTEQQMRSALVNGYGVAIAHVFLGLDAWKKDRMEDADFHFRIAHALQPNALRLVEYVAIHIAQASKEGTLSPFRLSLENEALWRRALRLLKMSSKIDESAFEQNLYTQSIILSNRQRWPEIPILIEPRIEEFSDSYRIRFLQLLIRACRENGNIESAQKYSKLLKDEAEKQEN